MNYCDTTSNATSSKKLRVPISLIIESNENRTEKTNKIY